MQDNDLKARTISMVPNIRGEKTQHDKYIIRVALLLLEEEVKIS